MKKWFTPKLKARSDFDTLIGVGMVLDCKNVNLAQGSSMVVQGNLNSEFIAMDMNDELTPSNKAATTQFLVQGAVTCKTLNVPILVIRGHLTADEVNCTALIIEDGAHVKVRELNYAKMNVTGGVLAATLVQKASE